MTDLDNAIQVARDALAFDHKYTTRTSGYIIIDVPAIGPNGGHYDAGYRVYSDVPQAPGGLMAPGELPPGEIVATLDHDGNVIIRERTAS